MGRGMAHSKTTNKDIEEGDDDISGRGFACPYKFWSIPEKYRISFFKKIKMR